MFLAKEGFEVTAVDGSESALSKLLTKVTDPYTERNIFTVCADVGSTGLPSQSFDAAVDIVTLAHNVNYCEIIEEIYRLLKPGAKLFSVWPTDNCAREPYEGKGPAVFLTQKQLHSAFRRMFTIEVGWVIETTPSGVFLDHWIVHGTRSD